MARLSLFEWLLSKAMKAVEQDLRDFDAIHAWAAQVGPALISGGDRAAA